MRAEQEMEARRRAEAAANAAANNAQQLPPAPPSKVGIYKGKELVKLRGLCVAL